MVRELESPPHLHHGEWVEEGVCGRREERWCQGEGVVWREEGWGGGGGVIQSWVHVGWNVIASRHSGRFVERG